MMQDQNLTMNQTHQATLHNQNLTMTQTHQATLNTGKQQIVGLSQEDILGIKNEMCQNSGVCVCVCVCVCQLVCAFVCLPVLLVTHSYFSPQQNQMKKNVLPVLLASFFFYLVTLRNN